MTDKSSQQEALNISYSVCPQCGQRPIGGIFACGHTLSPIKPEPQPSAKCEHKHTYSYSEVSELGAVAKSGMRKCVACGAEIDVRSAELPEPQPSAQSLELPKIYLPIQWEEMPGEMITEVAYKELLTENSSLRQQLAAEREAHEVTKKALELAQVDVNRMETEHMSYKLTSKHDWLEEARQSYASSPSQEGK